MENDPKTAAMVASMSANLAIERFVELAEAFGAVDNSAAQRAISEIETRLAERLVKLREEFRKIGAGDMTLKAAVSPIRDMMLRAKEQARKASRPN